MHMGVYEQIEYVEKESIHIITFFKNQYDDDTEVKYHFHRSLEIILPTIGGLHIFCDGKHERVQAGQPYIINSKDMHSIVPIFDDGYYMGYAFQIPYKILKYCNQNINMIYFENNQEIQKLLLPLLYQILESQIQEKEYQFLDQMNLTLQIMKTLLLNCASKRNQKGKITDCQKDQIIEITEYIKDNYTRPITVSTIAERFHYSYGHLERLFKENTGTNIIDFVMNVRLMHVESALIHDKKTVLEISEDAGFRNVKSLYLGFKKKHGVTPKQYRNNVRK